MAAAESPADDDDGSSPMSPISIATSDARDIAMNLAAYPTLAAAAKAQSAEAVTNMLNKGQDVNQADKDGNTALHWASWFCLDVMLDQLLEAGASISARNVAGEAPAHWAAMSSNLHALAALSRGGPAELSQPDADGLTPFLLLAQGDNGPVMEWMHIRGANIDEKDGYGRTALHWACFKGHVRTVQWLLVNQASLWLADDDGMTALHWASVKGHTQVCLQLLRVGAVHLIDAPDSSGDTPLQLATRKRFIPLVLHFYVCKALQALLERPFVFHNHYATLFVIAMILNIFMFLFIVLPDIFYWHPSAVMFWLMSMASTLCLWIYSCTCDPGWLTDRRMKRQFHPDDCVSQHIEQTDPPLALSMWNALATKLTSEGTGLSGDSSIGMPAAGPAGSLSRHDRQQSPRQIGVLESGSQSPRYGFAASSPRHSRTLETRGSTPSTDRSDMCLLPEGNKEYIELLQNGSFKQVCVICRVPRELRSHHCKECGRCVQRLDHHCPWIDNCVGIANQRSFVCFLVSLLLTLLATYYSAGLYLASDFRIHGRQGIEVRTGICSPVIVIFVCVSDVIWLVFVGMLVVRHTVYILVNMTTFEVLVQPVHVQRRFPHAPSQGRFWYLHGLTFPHALRNCVHYWNADLSKDVADFSGADGFTAHRLDGYGHSSAPTFGDLHDMEEVGAPVQSKLSRCESMDKEQELKGDSPALPASPAGDVHRRALALRTMD
eukprot:TRINITY_DN94030_c0_g1_i1.p1 TRINITY_DN94030_c0_g1~~TRINITY_DN94030_c0_g1_i1.p1  ORF type:complete len:719 (-),score=84.93 TRINITY_DN94030_c0_g1_i1:79-2235(-)